MVDILLERVAAVGKRLSRAEGFVAVAGLAWLLVGVCLGATPLLDPDEAKHAEIAREMMTRGRLVEPLINFEAYHHKPSFLYLIIGACYRLLGVGELSARLVPALACWTTLVLVFGFASRTRTSTGLIAATLLAACGFFVHVGRFTNFDALLTMAMTAAVLSLAAWLEDRSRPRLLVGFYLFTAVGVLVKGPVAVILVLVPVVYLLARGTVTLASLRPLLGVALAASVVLAWLVPTWLLAPEYIIDFLWVHNVQRYLVAADIFHPEPSYFFVPVVLGTLLPWSLLLPSALRSAWEGSPSERFLALYACWVVVFFSLSSGKLATYVLPAFPALAVLVARWCDRPGADRERGRALVSVAAALSAVLALVALVAIAYEVPGEEAVAWAFVPASVAGAAVLVAGRRRIRSTTAALMVLCAGMIVTVFTFEIVSPAALGRVTSDRDLARIAIGHGRPDRMVAFGVMPYSFLFYTGWPMVYRDTDDAYFAAVRDPGTALILTKDGRLPVLRSIVGDVELHEIGRNSRHILLSNR